MPDLFAEALAHHRAGRLDAAAALYRAILAQVPNHADCLNLLGVVLHQKGENTQAVELIQCAIQIKPKWPAYHVNLAAAFRGLGRHEEAIPHCRLALQLQPDLAEAHLALGQSLQALKQWAQAEPQFRWLRDHRPGDSRGPQTLANCLREQGRTDEALALYREALSRNPNDAAAHLGLGTELLLGDRNPGAAEPHLRKATELLPGQAIAWTNYGSCLVMLGKETEALRVFDEGLRLAPNDPGLGINVGQAWLGLGNSQAAENCFQAVLSFHADYPGALIGLADIHREADRVEEAIPLYQRALQLDPAGSAYKGLADAHWDFGDVERAVALLRDGIARHPRDAENQVRLGMILASGGDLTGAEECCRDALDVRPGHPSALVELALMLRAKLPAPDRQLLAQALQQPAAAGAHAAMHFGLAQVNDGDGDFTSAAEDLRIGNSLMKAHNESRNQGYDVALFQALDRGVQSGVFRQDQRLRRRG